MDASYVGGFDDFGEGDEFGKISSNCQMTANKLNTWRPAMSPHSPKSTQKIMQVYLVL